MRIQMIELWREAELAARRGDTAEASRAFIDAGDRAVSHQLWRGAARSYRGALELDVLRREPVTALARIAAHLGQQQEWAIYASVLDEVPAWPRFGCRSVQVIAHDGGSVVECAGVGPVLELAMTHAEYVEVRADGRFSKMPLAMALLIVRRALWPVPREHARKPARVRAAFGGRAPVSLDEHGDWTLM
jgi:hypothetical protein